MTESEWLGCTDPTSMLRCIAEEGADSLGVAEKSADDEELSSAGKHCPT
jgi:hypothetical protein